MRKKLNKVQKIKKIYQKSKRDKKCANNLKSTKEQKGFRNGLELKKCTNHHKK